MKRQFALLSLTVLVTIISSGNGRGQKTGGSNIVNILESPSCFIGKCNEYQKAHPNKGASFLYYAYSKHSLSEFANRCKEYETKYPNKGASFLYYAASNHSLSEFRDRGNEFENKYPNKGASFLYYAQCNHNLCE